MDSEADALRRLKELGAATVYEALGRVGAMDHAIKPLDPGFSVVGRAFTVDSAPGDNLAVHYGAHLAGEGDVLVVDAKEFTAAGPWGDVLSEYAQKKGIAGLVIDGAVRDSRAIVGLGFPVFCRDVCIKGTDKVNLGRVGEPIVCGGVTVRPGDVIVGDADGVTVVPQELVDEACAAGARREQAEAGYRTAIAGGASLIDLIKVRDTLDAALAARKPGS
ncbi:4-carboxy-4-hydroxy-2-oxoadipate aldolase/oxaloacetate decarboxylase [Pseudonocardia ailaonensis]|uniref:Putative 4-hydroxy-4-methyl-2-oxoglutarate aldolase n=1 Tax=Pseudonocardia ailaonensis TaxID=367279 RepID=A0ABN2N8U2_9PSEU